MDRIKARTLAKKLQEFLAPFAAEHGVAVRVGGGKYTAGAVGNLTLKLELAEKSADGVVKTAHAVAFETYASTYGLKPSDLGREFAEMGRRYRIIGAKPRSHRYPILCENLGDGKTYKLPASRVARALLATNPSASVPA